jgi:ATP-dependent RNA helicase DDX60
LYKSQTKEYAILYPQWMDLVSEVGAAELFLIDGDSLLLDLLHSEDAKIDWTYGGQFLHLTFIVERYLSWFKQRGGNFRVLFFDCNRALWIKADSKDELKTWSRLAARECIIRHLQMNTDVIVDIFDSWLLPDSNNVSSQEDSWSWRKVLHMYPAFIAVSDAECVGAEDPEVAFLLRSFMFFCSAQRNATVFTSSVTVDNNRVMGFVVSPHIHIGWQKFIPECERIYRDRLVLLNAASGSPASASDATGQRNKILIRALQEVQKSASWNAELAKAVLLHSVLLDHLPLTSRSLRVPDVLEASRGAPIVAKFLSELFKASFELMKTQPAGQIRMQDKSVADFFDGRLFFAILNLLTSLNPSLDENSLGFTESMLQDANALLGQVDSNLRGVVPLLHGADPKPTPAAQPLAQGAVFPATAPWVQEIVGDSLAGARVLDPQDPAVIAAANSGESIVQEQQWAVSKAPLMDAFWSQTSKGHTTGEGNGGWRELRAEQFLARFIHQYAESLEGSASLHQKTMVLSKAAFVGGSESSEAVAEVTPAEPEVEAPKGGKKAAPPKKGKAPKAGAPKKKSKAEEIREANLARLKKKEEDGEAQRWISIKIQLEDWIKTDPPRVEPTVKEFVKTCQVSDVVLEAQMWRLQFYYRRWRANQTRDDMMVDVFNQIHRIADHHGKELDERNTTILQQVLMDLGFQDSTQLLVSDLGCKATGKETNPNKRSSIRFMLEHMGHLLKRKDSSGPDPRVGFVPDNWQKDLLDVVDRRGSALVCAPTSSGKTFISYYCMEQVLREGPNGVAVFVSPTKALVNQVAAEVYARFGNLQSQYGDRSSVFGYFTRDYRYKPLKCRVLVTVPECLEMLLLSPQPQFEEWRKKIRYCIFDEVHSIGDLASGEIWEHVMSLVDCPILALSATVRNPNDLKNWIDIRQKLQQSQEQRRAAAAVAAAGGPLNRSYEVALIAHHNRYADLEKSVFLPVIRDSSAGAPAPMESAWKMDPSLQGKLFRLHPCVSLSGRRIRDFGFPSDVSFEPRDSLELFDAMVALQAQLPAEKQKSLERLNPDIISIFQGVRRITRPMTREYEKLVKAELLSWATEGYEQQVDSVLAKLSESYRKTMQETEVALAKVDTRMESQKYLLDHIVDVIFTLASQDRLPVIIFNYDAEICEKLLELLVERLEKEEYKKSQTGESVKERRQMQKARDQQQRKQKLMRDAKLKEKTALELVQKEHDDAFIPEEEDVDRDFSYCAADVEISKEAFDVIKSYPPKMPWVRAVKRGIGIHHAGLPTKYRQAVERLFRVRALQVVFATSTLSLGIHMPCKTVVFAGDSVHLNALTFRQMSGRAGRRGFDKLGKVAFVGIPDAKINRLLTGDLPVLQGSVPCSIGLVHRCENLVQYTQNRLSAQESVVRLFQDPLSQNITDSELRQYFRFSADYLRRQGLVNAAGTPIGFSELAAYLWWIEPSNYVLTPLIRSGLLYELCDELLIKSKGIEVAFKELLHLFAIIVAPVKLHKSVLQDQELLKSTSSKVVMEAPSESIQEFIRVYNKDALDSFVSYISAASKPSAPDQILPLSRLDFHLDHREAHNFLSHLRSHAASRSVRSPFCVDDSQDTFASIHQLIYNCRDTVYIDASMLPIVGGLASGSSNYVLNRYAIDFFEHSNLDLIRTSNALRGSAWLTLNSFVVALQGVKVVLDEIQPPARDQYVHIMRKLVDEYSARFNRLTWFS